MKENLILVFEEFIPCKIPTDTFQNKGLGTKKNGKAFIYTRTKTQQSISYLKACIFKAIGKYTPAEPYDCGVCLDVIFIYKAKKKSDIGRYKITKPDRDNMLKTIQDILGKKGKLKFVKDDSRFADGRLAKIWGETEGIGLFFYKEK